MRKYTHKVHYYETDKMGIVHHSNYIKWLEEARVEMMREMGYSFKSLEEQGIFSPVLSYTINIKVNIVAQNLNILLNKNYIVKD